MLHLKYHAFARRQLLHRCGDLDTKLFAHQAALGILRWATLLLPFKKIRSPVIMVSGISLRSLIFRTRLPPSQMIEANIGDDAVQPGIKAAFKAKAMQVTVDLQKSILIDVARVFGALHQI